MSKKLIAEVQGTLILVFFGCGPAVLMGAQIGMTGISLAFGLAIGLTLAAIHLVGINVTGVSVNPARSIGPVIFVGGTALSQLWVFILAPLAGGALAGAIYKAGITRA